MVLHLAPSRVAVMKWMKPYPCLLQLPDLLGVKKQKRDVDKRKENEVSLQMMMTAKKDEDLEYPSSLFKAKTTRFQEQGEITKKHKAESAKRGQERR